MHIFNKKFDLYTVFRRAHRMTLRAIGMFVALFSSNRIEAATLTVQTLCPKCQTIGNSICNTGVNIHDWSSYGGNFREMQFCIPVGNQGPSHPAITDATCVSKLKKWGLCQTALGGGRYELYNQNLNCSSGQVNYNGTYAVEYSPNASQFGYSSAPGGAPLPWVSVTGWVSSRLGGTILGMGDGYPAICCFVSGNASNGMCWVVSNVSPHECNVLVECGLISSNSAWSGYPIISHSGADVTNACPQILQDYFNGSSNDRSTGYCSGNSIYADGLETMLIAQACNNETVFSHCNGATVFLNCACGFMGVSCQYDSGYYWVGHQSDPLYERDPQAFCKQCDTNVSGYSSLHDFDIYAVEPGTGGRYGIHTCTAHANNPTADEAYRDFTGTFSIEIKDDCPYLKELVVETGFEIIK